MVMAHHWGYTDENGPHTWHKSFPLANGQRQSPVNIDSKLCVRLSSEQSINACYPNSFPQLPVQNTGHGWKVEIPPEVMLATCLSGGPLTNKYQLLQFHCHWGPDTNSGSEHTVDGQNYPGEIHFVHWNREKFTSVSDAVTSDKGLT